MRKLMLFAIVCFVILSCNNEKKTDEATTVSSDTSAVKQQSEFADPKYAEIGKKMIASMSSGSLDDWNASYADNAVYQWSAGDSLAGKEAIVKYWKERRTSVIDSINFSYDIWLPLKVNVPQKGPDREGVWLLSWYQVNVKYKNGQKLSFWTHTDHHFDANDKIDRTIQYIDRAPINAAMSKK